MSDNVEQRIASLLVSGKLDEAFQAIEEAASSVSLSEIKLLNLKGLLARANSDVETAENLLLEAIRIDNDFVPALSNLTSLYVSLGRYRDALAYAKRAFDRTNPKTLAVAMPLITILLDSARVEEAVRVIEALPQKKREHKDPQLALAACYRQKGIIAEADSIITKLLSAHPDDPTILRVHADLIGEVGRVDPLPYYERALTAAQAAGKKNLSALLWNMSLHLLRARDFERGWQYYEEGLSNTVGTLGRPLPQQFKFAKRAMLEEINTSHWTFIIVEQGIGDQILFLSAMQEAIDRLVKVALICEERLKPILKRSFPSLVLLSAGVIESIQTTGIPNNGYIPLGSLFGFFRPSLDSFLKSRRPFLRVNKSKFVRFRDILKRKASGRAIIGLSWKGGFWENQQRNKAVSLSSWEAVLKQPILAVNLQYGNVEDDLRWSASCGYDISVFPNIDFKQDLDGWLAISAACDGVISVSTALVHFAGACNQKVAVVMPESKGPWILGLNDNRSIAYPNVHYFRRKEEESLEQLLVRVSKIIA